MRSFYSYPLIVVITVFCLQTALSGCLTRGDLPRELLGRSTLELEAGRKDALTHIFDYDFNTCYERMDKILRSMPKVSCYARKYNMIAVYYIDPNTTPVGVFFKEIDAAHTEVEVSSPGTDAKKWIADNLFSETVLQSPEVNSIKAAKAYN